MMPITTVFMNIGHCGMVLRYKTAILMVMAVAYIWISVYYLTVLCNTTQRKAPEVYMLGTILQYLIAKYQTTLLKNMVEVVCLHTKQQFLIV